MLWHDACCDARNLEGVRTCTRGPMTTMSAIINPGPLDASNQVCEEAFAAREDNPAPLENPIKAMCDMAWRTLYGYIETPTEAHPNGFTSCDFLLFIQTTWHVCSEWSQMDGTRIDYAVLEDPSYCSTFFTCGTHNDQALLEGAPDDASALIDTGSCEDVDECAVANGGCAETCINEYGGPATCTCPGGLENPPACDRCSDLCACPSLFGGSEESPNTPCENGAACLEGDTDSFVCQCADGFSGVFCELVADQCEVGYNCPHVPDVPMRDGRGAYMLEAFAPILLNTHSENSWVGVGTQAPQSKLDVAGTFKVEGDMRVREQVNVLGVSLLTSEMERIDRLLELYGEVPEIKGIYQPCKAPVVAAVADRIVARVQATRVRMCLVLAVDESGCFRHGNK